MASTTFNLHIDGALTETRETFSDLSLAFQAAVDRVRDGRVESVYIEQIGGREYDQDQHRFVPVDRKRMSFVTRENVQLWINARGVSAGFGAPRD